MLTYKPITMQFRRTPYWTMLAVTGALLFTAAITVGWWKSRTELQRFYYWDYTKASISAKFNWPRPMYFIVPQYRTTYGYQWLTEDNINLVDPSLYARRGIHVRAANMRLFLQASIYHGNGLLRSFLVPGGLSLLALLCCVPFGAFFDIKRIYQLQIGTPVRGPEYLTSDEYNRKMRGRGLYFLLSEEDK